MPSRGATSYSLSQTDSLPIRRGVELTSEGIKRTKIYNDSQGGRKLFLQAIEEDSTYAPAYYQMSSLMLQERNDSSLYYINKAYELDTLNKWYIELYAQVLSAKEEYASARKFYRKLIDISGQNPEPYLYLAFLYQQTQLPYSAISVLDTAELRAGKNPYISSLKRQLLVATRQTDRAIEETRQDVENTPFDIENRIALAELYGATGKDSLAQIEYQEALKIDSTSVDLIRSLTDFYAKRNNYPSYLSTLKLLFMSTDVDKNEKISIFKRVTADNSFYSQNFYAISQLASQLWLLYPKDKDVVKLYAQHLIFSGMLDKALDLYKERTLDRPAEYEYFRMVIDIESYKQRTDSVALYSTRAIELFPDKHELYLDRANSLSYAKKYEEAIKSYEEAYDIATTDSLKSMICGHIGDIHHQIGSNTESANNLKIDKRSLKKAYKYYDRALDLDRNNVLVLNNYAYFLSIEGKHLERALDMSGRAIAIEKNNPTYLDTYAWILFKLNRAEEAKEHMKQVIAFNSSQSAEIPFHYAEILASLGETFMAEIYYDRALKLGYPEVVIKQRKSKLKEQ